MQKVIVMMGAPGAGKGTQARRLAERLGYPQISTGDILREMAAAETPLGREIRARQAAGRLVSDDVLAEVILTRTSRPDCASGYILDGFPRTLNQARMLERLSGQQGKDVILLRVVVSEDSLMKRLTGRRTCSQCGEIYNVYLRPPQHEGFCDLDGAPLEQRSDDNAESVTTRLRAYEESTAPLIDFYRTSGRLFEINGELPVDEVFRSVMNVVTGKRK
ncbi:MAG: adenylate kinase [Acidobacteria bacterium]|nr:adenylate kinase [Acidobacteriota bacterium]MCW5968376.1 adenylate kinase [Blastocatellales bacterium]